MLETALAFTATTTVSIRLHRLAVAIMEPTGVSIAVETTVRETPSSSTRCIEMHFGINMHFPYGIDEGRNVRNAINEAGRFRKNSREMVVLRKIAHRGFLYQIERIGRE